MKKFVLAVTALSISSALNAAILDVHGDIKVNGKTVITEQGEVIDASSIDLAKYLVWPEGSYLFNGAQGTKQFSLEMVFNQDGKAIYEIETEDGEITDRNDFTYHQDGSYTETKEYQLTKSYNHEYQVIIEDPIMCQGTDPKTGIYGTYQCMNPVNVLDENGHNVYDENGHTIFEFEVDENGKTKVDGKGEPILKMVPVFHKYSEFHKIDVTENTSCTKSTTSSVLFEQAYKTAKLAVSVSKLLYKDVSVVTDCDVSYSFPEGASEQAKASLLAGPTHEQRSEKQETIESITVLSHTSYTFNEQRLDDCILVSETEGGEASIRTYCADIGIVEHKAPPRGDNNQQPIVFKRDSFEAPK